MTLSSPSQEIEQCPSHIVRPPKDADTNHLPSTNRADDIMCLIHNNKHITAIDMVRKVTANGTVMMQRKHVGAFCKRIYNETR